MVLFLDVIQLLPLKTGWRCSLLQSPLGDHSREDA
ncbi:hypothetical protein NGA_0711600 [Nannochloropsis gaditana CCMP526]|nr:hypothetical protein NGA_0711600 [Nannochloropsis gaditana CCMP526]EKU23168.1 hypothetical protein NGA_0711600 [Nannochloropsis gaditana CCMP526]|eukprot:XP_005852665.1 hypothetical protein NGA_0711600 [Nannochloropsis gaditana CCMP526]